MVKNWVSNFKLIFFALVISIIFLFIIAIKGYTYQGIGIVYLWTIFVTTFMASRVVGSFFYKPLAEPDPSYNPKITFIIPCKNEEKAIYHTIQSCAEVDYPKDKMEIIAINDGSTDNTLSEMKRAEKDYKNIDIKIADWKINKGKREGMVYGFKHAKGELVIQLDSDSFPDKNSIRHLISPFKDRKIGGCVGNTLPYNKNENILTKMQYAYYFMSFRALKATESIFGVCFCLSGCFACYRKEYVVPFLDEWLKETFIGMKVSYGDDRSLSNLVLKKGYKTIYCADAQATTIVPNKLKVFLKQMTRWKKGYTINSFKASRFILKRDAFVAFTYFFPLMFLTFLTPIIAFKALIINPLFFHISPMFYILGILFVSTLCYLHYQVYAEEKKHGKYIFLWSILNMTFLSYILIYALYDLFIKKNVKWGTR